jgi:hypothetical protein
VQQGITLDLKDFRVVDFLDCSRHYLGQISILLTPPLSWIQMIKSKIQSSGPSPTEPHPQGVHHESSGITTPEAIELHRLVNDRFTFIGTL